MADETTGKQKAMTKAQTAAHISDKFGFPKMQAAEILDEISALACAETMKRGEFTLPGIGKLIKQDRAARMGRNRQRVRRSRSRRRPS